MSVDKALRELIQEIVDESESNDFEQVVGTLEHDNSVLADTVSGLENDLDEAKATIEELSGRLDAIENRENILKKFWEKFRGIFVDNRSRV